MMKRLFTLLITAIALLTAQTALAADPDLSNYTVIKTLDFTKATYPSATNITIESDAISGITAYDTGNKKQQKLYNTVTPEDLAGWLAFQGVAGKKGWTIRSTYGGLWSYGAQRSAAVLNLKQGYVVAFNCTQDAANVMTLTNGDGEPDGSFTYEKSEDSTTYYCTMTADGYVGFCGAKSKGYIASIVIYAPGTVLITPTAKYSAVNGTSRTVTFSGANLAYNTDGSDTYTNWTDASGNNVNTYDVTVSENTTYYVVSTNGSEKSDALKFDIEAGTEISLPTPSVSISTMGEGFTKTYSVSCSTSDILLNPTAKLTYSFIPSGDGTAESDVECDGTINATASGTYTVTASAEGYTSSTIEIDNTTEYELTKTIDLTALDITTQSANWKLLNQATTLPGSSSQWLNKYADVVTDEYFYDYTAETASDSSVIEGLTVQISASGMTPKYYTGFGMLYPTKYLNADGTEADTWNNSSNIGILGGTADQYGVYTYLNNYGKSGTKTAIVAGDSKFPLYRYSDCLTKVEIYSPKAIAKPDTATIVFADSTYAMSGSASTEGDITANFVITTGDLTTTIYPAAEGNSTPNRFWNSKGVPQLRVYSNKIVFNAATGKAIKSVAMKTQKWNNGNTFNGDSVKTWEGNSTNVILKVGGNTQINTITVTLTDADEATTTYRDVAKVSNIGALKALANGTNVELTLTNAKALVCNSASSATTYLEDETGAVTLDNEMTMVLSNLNLANSTSVNGTIYGTYSASNMPVITMNEEIEMTSITVADTTFAPATMTIADLKKAENLAKYITIGTATMAGNNLDGMTAAQGTDTINVNDIYFALGYCDYSAPAEARSITGVVAINGNDYVIYPIGVKGISPVVISGLNALKDMPDGVDLQINLTDAKVTKVGATASGTAAYIEDATSGVAIDNELSNNLMEWWLESGKAINGSIYAQYSSVKGMPTLSMNEDVEKNATSITATATEITPDTMTIAEAEQTANLARFIMIEDVELTGNITEGITATSGNSQIAVNDRFFLFDDDFIVPAKGNISGILAVDAEGNYTIYPISTDGIKAPATPAVEVADIATLRTIESGTSVKLTLKDAKITVMEPSWTGNIIILEDSTGAIYIDAMAGEISDQSIASTLPEAFANDSLKLNGTLYGTFINEYGVVGLEYNDSTATSVVTAEAMTDLKPLVYTNIAEATVAANDLRLVRLENVKLNVSEYAITLTQDGDTIQVYDMFSKMNAEGELNLTYFNGIISYSEDDAFIIPIGDPVYEVVVEQAYKTISEDEVFLPTADAVAQAISEGWLEGGQTRVDNKKGNIDPATGEALDSPKAFEGVGVKQGNSAKTLVIYVTGVEEVVAYGVSTSSSATRTLIVTATDEDGNVITTSVEVGPSSTGVADLKGLDANKKYKIEFTGVEGEKAGDVAIHGIKFVHDASSDGINGVNSNVKTVSGNVYTLGGTMVRKAGESLNGLSKGLYIINGKKVVVK